MSESKVYMFPENGNNMMSMLAPILQQRGVDPNVLLAMKNGNGFNGDGGWFMWIIFLFFLMGWGGNGWNPNGRNQDLGNIINNDSGRELLMQAIQGNGNAIGQLANNLNCTLGDVQGAINNVMTQIQGVGNQVGMSSQQIINSIQAGNCNIASKLADCCCENRLAICQQTNTLQNSINNVSTGQERGFSSIAYETQRQTCDLQNSIKSATESILQGQRDAEMREMQNKIDALREANSHKDVVINNGQQTAVFSQMIQQATTPLATALNTLQGDINSVKCKLPDTTTIQYSPVVGVPSCVAAQLGLGQYNLYGTNTLWG